MKLGTKVVAFALSGAALSLAYVEEAKACGGCLAPQSENTQVTSHRMILSISPEATTLWDQITYSGEPSEFAWVLPVVGLADVELSSDALFEMLDQTTTVQVFSPQLNCPPSFCGGATGAGGGGFSSPDAAGEGGVTVIAQETVGPYETVQLSASEPNALRNWLDSNGYNIPEDIDPVIDAYVEEGFSFLALKLVPGEGIDKMRPVRVSTAGASAELPLRMVAAGTGRVTPITLWILGEGRYEPTNFTSFEITSPELIWNWDTQSSNYKQLRSAGFDAAGGSSWLVEAAEPLSAYWIRDSLVNLAQYQPLESGYADADGEGAVEAAQADVDALFSTIPEGSTWISRIYGELSRTALATDLELGASMNQTTVDRFLQANRAVGTAPTCPPPPPGCEDFTGASTGTVGGGSGTGTVGDSFGRPGGSGSDVKPGSCAISGQAEGPLTLAAASAIAALSLVRRRRNRG
ncbi:uncharacterized protein SOCE26_006920 [Sorangium cellulosum]|uniref:DUF2330 domain-containing protein n=1 Tax=Sorangium cellulosum TaxID=56 RepID=A0A2L0EJ24_SORCE|nr:DUF2330 domain-containing protein [Sorangium cellulosum]AUX39303.1 uncharacterized protein SOCE26_006920 [Sorangium cellulosum]